MEKKSILATQEGEEKKDEMIRWFKPHHFLSSTHVV